MTQQAFKGYKNIVNNSRRIFSREDIGKMSSKEFSRNEKAINHQIAKIGAPSDNALRNSSDVIFIASYSRSDGTKVQSHYRSKPGHGSIIPRDDQYGNSKEKFDINKKPEEIFDEYLKKNYPQSDTESPYWESENENSFRKIIYESVIKDMYPQMYEKYKKEHPDKKEKVSESDKETEKGFEGVQMVIDLVDAGINDLPDSWGGKAFLKGAVSQAQGFKDNLVEMEKANRRGWDYDAEGEYFEEMFRQTIEGLGELVNDIATNGFGDIDWLTYAKKLNITQFASMINQYVGMAATIAIDIVPNVMKIVDSSKTGDKEIMFEAIANLSEASVPMLISIGESIANLPDKIKESKEVKATIRNLETVSLEAQKVEAKVLSKASSFEPTKSVHSGDLTGGASGVSELKESGKISQSENGLLNSINNKMNSEYQDARDLMNISIEGPKKFQQNKDFAFISSDFTGYTNSALNLKGDNVIPNNWDGVIFNKNSSLSANLSNSATLQMQVMEAYGGNILPEKIHISIDDKSDRNLFRAIHEATIIDPRLNPDGIFTGTLFDKYDFAKMPGNNYGGITGVNNAAYYLQNIGILKNYYILVPIKFRWK